jgi:TonB family protein
MKFWIAALLLLLLPTAAGAEAPVASDGPVVTKPQICRIDYPMKLAIRGIGGTANVVFRVTPEGRVTGAFLAGATGQDALDDATLECAKGWDYRPKTIDGKPLEAAATATVAWRVAGGQSPPMLVIKSPVDSCMPTVRPNLGKRRVTKLSYTLSSDGVPNVTIEDASGDATLDTLAVGCAAKWRFAQTEQKDSSLVVVTAYVGPSLKSIPPEPTGALQRTAIFDWNAMLGEGR